MSGATMVTVAILVGLGALAMLAFLVGWLLGKARAELLELQGENRGYDEGSRLDDKLRAIGERAKRFGR